VSGPKKVAVVVPAFAAGGGVSAVARFLVDVLDASGRYEPALISLALSSVDPTSVCLRRPRSWLRGIQVEERQAFGRGCRHVGAFISDVETQRYRPRRRLTEILNSFDLIQVVCGSPAWAYVAHAARPPVAVQMATLVRHERESALREDRGSLGVWRRAMTHLTGRYERSLSHVRVFFVESRHMQQAMRGRLSDAQLLVFAPPGVDTELFNPVSGNGGSDPYVLSVGRFADPRKNVALLFRAYHRLRATMDHAPRLILAGRSPPSQAAWRLSERLGISRHVEFQRAVSEGELAALYRNASLFVLSSNEEGLGIVLLEAMASGIPVVSTDCGGSATAVVPGETGYLTPVGDPEALAGAIRRVLENEELCRSLGRAGRSRAETHFSREVAGNRFLAVYDRLVDGGASRG